LASSRREDAEGQRAPTPAGNGTRILVVDDEIDFALTLAKRLSRRGFTVETAPDGEHALDELRRHTFDAVVLDLAMPGLDGIETLREMRRLDPDLQVVLLTGHGTVSSGVTAIKLGAMDYLEKPVEFAELLVRLEEASRRTECLHARRVQELIDTILTHRGW
jgi:DNA-binding response OmpR family regulator